MQVQSGRGGPSSWRLARETLEEAGDGFSDVMVGQSDAPSVFKQHIAIFAHLLDKRVELFGLVSSWGKARGGDERDLTAAAPPFARKRIATLMAAPASLLTSI